MADRTVISFPRMGDYHVPIKNLLQRLFPEAEVMPPPPITKRTLELGGRHSPDFVCAPFKYNLGNYVEALEAGANVLLQTGTGCRYGYYGEVQERILRDLGYDFSFVSFAREKARPREIYKTVRCLGSPLSAPEILRAFMVALESVRLMDSFDYYMRESMGFEAVPGSFEDLRLYMLKAVGDAKSLPELWRLRSKYMGALRRLEVGRPEKPLRVGIVGELFTLMEPLSNFQLERELARMNISVSRRMSVTFLLTGGGERALKKTGDYLEYTVGANGADSVAQSLYYAERGYDGVIHMKSFGCAPELSAEPALRRLSGDRGIPILNLSFDMHTSEAGLRTRLEAFADMIEMRRGGADGAGGLSGSGRGLDLNKRSYSG